MLTAIGDALKRAGFNTGQSRARAESLRHLQRGGTVNEQSARDLLARLIGDDAMAVLDEIGAGEHSVERMHAYLVEARSAHAIEPAQRDDDGDGGQPGVAREGHILRAASPSSLNSDGLGHPVRASNEAVHALPGPSLTERDGEGRTSHASSGQRRAVLPSRPAREPTPLEKSASRRVRQMLAKVTAHDTFRVRGRVIGDLIYTDLQKLAADKDPVKKRVREARDDIVEWCVAKRVWQAIGQPHDSSTKVRDLVSAATLQQIIDETWGELGAWVQRCNLAVQAGNNATLGSAAALEQLVDRIGEDDHV